MIYTLFSIGDTLKEGFIGIILALDTLIFGLISSAFKIFMTIAGARLLSSDAYNNIANKIYVVIGVLMLFVLSYAILRAIIDPDQSTKGELGPKMIKNVVIAVVGLAAAPFIFNILYQAQGLMLEQDVLGKLFFRIDDTEPVNTGGSMTVGGQTVSVPTNINPNTYIKEGGGAVTATSLWQAFFYPAEDSGLTAADIEADASDYYLAGAGWAVGCAASATALAFLWEVPVINLIALGATAVTCINAATSIAAGVEVDQQTTDGHITLEEAYTLTSSGESFGIYTVFLKNYVEEGEISYLFGISTIAGAFALYAFFTFSIDMGIRAAKLAYLQIIAPIPLTLQVLPKFKDNFNSYIKSVTSTFMEVFIRISVVYVVVYLICNLPYMFSSLSMWGSNSDLNGVEKMLAIALLILGLIAFCQRAPKIISESLHLPQNESLKDSLNFRKKLAEGGFFGAKAVIGGGARSAVRNWNTGRDNGKSFGENLMSAAGGLGSGAVRAIREQARQNKMAETWRMSNDIAETAAQAATDAKEARDKRKKRHESDIQALTAAQSAEQAAEAELATKQADYNAALAAHGATSAITQDALDKLNAAQKAYDEAYAARTAAEKARFASSAIGAYADNLQKRVRAWSTATVKTDEEEAAIKFGDAMDALKGNLREEAYKKDTYGAKALKKAHDALAAAQPDMYADGWDEQSANAETRRRREFVQNGLSAQYSDYISRRRALSAMSLTDPGRAAAEAALNSSKAALETALSTFDVDGLGTIATLDANGDLQIDMSDVILDEAVARERHARKVEGLRVSMEAAADAWVHDQAQIEGSNTNRDIQVFLTENTQYINEHATDNMVVDYDSSGHPVVRTIAEVVDKAFGDGAHTTGTFKPGVKFKDQSQYEVEVILAGGGTAKITYEIDETTGEYIPVKSSDEAHAPASSYSRYAKKDFFNGINRGIQDGKIKGASSKTAISRAADAGKTSATHTKTHELAEKEVRKRQAQADSKNGK